MAAEDVASALVGFATNSPVNGTVEIGGPERFRLDEAARRDLAARHDPREVIADPQAHYYGIALASGRWFLTIGRNWSGLQFRRLA
jgi:uncharacterized protein YbjT (DUF2867 family)